MNINRGLFRVWLVLSAIFIFGTLTVSYNEIVYEFKNKYAAWKPPTDATALIPSDCKIARGVKSEFDSAQLNALNDANARLAASGNKEPVAAIKKYDYFKSRDDIYCWYELSKFREQFPEYNDLSDKEISDAAYTKAFGLIAPNYDPWGLLLKTILFSIAVPLGFLILGWSALWAIAGFKSSTN